MREKKLTIVIPIYNEEGTIGKLINAVIRVKFSIPYEIIAVNDGSTDNSYRELLKFKKNENLKIFNKEKNMGKGFSIRNGIKGANGDIIIIQDADLEYNPEEIPKLIRPIIENKVMVVYGSRFLGNISNMSLSYKLGNIILTKITNLLFGSRLTDMETCYKAISREVLNNISLTENGFEIEAEITAKILKGGYEIREVPIEYHARSHVKGKKISWVDGIKTAFLLFKYKYLTA